MTGYTPTTDEVRAMYVTGTPPHRVTVPAGNAEFDRWLAQHDAEVAANTVLGIMHRLDTGDPRVGEQLTQMHDEWLREAGGEAKSGRCPCTTTPVFEREGREALVPLRSDCPCAACDPGLILDGKPTGLPSRMNVCPDCGNKRCPKAANHARWQCSGSNAVGQVGVPVEHEHRWVSNPTLGDRGGFAIQSCTTCTATREEPS